MFETLSGHTGGQKANPTHGEVSAGGTGHADAVQISYDPSRIRYIRLLEGFWHNIDPTAKDRRFCDAGHQYRPAIFVHDQEQRRIAEQSRRALTQSGRFPEPISTGIVTASHFCPVEDCHQNYDRENPIHYSCGRDQRPEELPGSVAESPFVPDPGAG